MRCNTANSHRGIVQYCQKISAYIADIDRVFIKALQDTLNVSKESFINHSYTFIFGRSFVFSQSLRHATKELKEYVLKDEGYEWIGNEYKRKSRLYPHEIEVEENGDKIKVSVDEKQVIFYNKDYDKRAKAVRQLALLKNTIKHQNPY